MDPKISAVTLSALIRRSLRVCYRNGLKTTSLHILLCMAEETSPRTVGELEVITGLPDAALRGWLRRMEGRDTVSKTSQPHQPNQFRWQITTHGMGLVWDALGVLSDGSVTPATEVTVVNKTKPNQTR